MRWISCGMSWSLVLACVSACPGAGKPGGDTETNTDPTTEPSVPATDGASNTSLPTGTTAPPTGTTDDSVETGLESSATETVGTADTGAVTETGGQTDPDTDDIETSLAPETDGEGLPLDCQQSDLLADASFELDFLTWDPLGNFDRDVLCLVDAVTVDESHVTTTMTCHVDGAPEPASLRFRDAFEGPVDWAAGDEVRLRALGATEFEFKHIVELRAAADNGILAVAVHGGSDNNSGFPEAFLPLVYGFSLACGETADPIQIDIIDPGKAELHLISKHRGTLPIDAEHQYVVDVGEAIQSESPHFPVEQAVLLRRVRVGG
ncbi:hypothetical protein [Nannocystis sp. SCPEA4]|uniref:hypothetical protein n=1 Tax=Nannocystis sp. SCPEA4 TaxID=2996787 RepID=UPI00226F94E0|nr:hypothetical protein [Nannocystis sp. SCPEA4]MCY1054551.1 hypothetical protein [Nannocystis sp. SCPEA4]